MKPICTPNLKETLKNSNLLLDTCTIIEMLKNEEVRKIICHLSENNCNLVSISPVKDELTYGANSVSEYNDVSEFISSQQILLLDEIRSVYPEREVETIRIALSRCKKINPSYVDRILLSIPYHYRQNPEKIYLITLNHKDVPTELYKCIGMISYYVNRNFRNIGIYEFNNEEFNKMMKDIMNELGISE